jgi:CBS domain-containing protein
MTTVTQLLRNKGAAVYAVGPETEVGEILTLMADKNIGAVLVMEGDTLTGIFSERDYVRQIVKRDGLPMTTLVKEIMTSKVRYVHPNQTLEDCMALMTGKRFRHLPVLDDNQKVVGVISIGDVVKAIISRQEFLIEQLENYIVGT